MLKRRPGSMTRISSKMRALTTGRAIRWKRPSWLFVGRKSGILLLVAGLLAACLLVCCPSSSVPVITGCSSVRYQGHTFSITGCQQPGVRSFRIQTYQGGAFGHFYITCSGGCIATATAIDESDIVTVPDVVGLTALEAQNILEEVGLAVSLSAQYDPSVPAGVVLSQYPSSGLNAMRGSAVDLVVSKGPGPGVVPDTIGLTQPEAEDAITWADLTVGAVSQQYNVTVSAGEVILQEPEGGATVAPGSPVNLIVSKGPGPAVVVPDVVGATLADAGEALVDAGLFVNEGTDFEFRVKYMDPESDPPADDGPFLHVLSGDSEIALSPFPMDFLSWEVSTGDYIHGALYKTSLKLDPGDNYAYYVSASDSQGASIVSETLPGPVAVLAVPVWSAVKVLNATASIRMLPEKTDSDICKYGSPALVDIDADGDLDLFLGRGGLWFYRNDGFGAQGRWTLVTEQYAGISADCITFCDIDSDGDFDLFSSTYYGHIDFYEKGGIHFLLVGARCSMWGWKKRSKSIPLAV